MRDQYPSCYLVSLVEIVVVQIQHAASTAETIDRIYHTGVQYTIRSVLESGSCPETYWPMTVDDIGTVQNRISQFEQYPPARDNRAMYLVGRLSQFNSSKNIEQNNAWTTTTRTAESNNNNTYQMNQKHRDHQS